MTEHDLSDGTGLELAARVRDLRPSVGCVLFTAADRDELATDESDAVAEYVVKDGRTPAEQLWRTVAFTASFRAQTAYPLPQNEDDRLAALDTSDFDSETIREDVEQITDLAARHLDVAMASINLIKEHSQEFLVCHGADLTTSERLTVGTLCTYDDEPRTFSEDEQAFLATLADVTISLLGLHHEVAELRDDRERRTDGAVPDESPKSDAGSGRS